MIELKCNKCGWVHMGVTREFATKEVESFNKYYDTLTIEQQIEYYGGHKSNISKYEKCNRCGNTYTDFRLAEPDDCPLGSTIGPIIFAIDYIDGV